MVGSLYLLFAGHNQPGGGFAGGIVAGAAVALRYISGGIAEVRSLSRGRPWRVLGGRRADRRPHGHSRRCCSAVRARGRRPGRRPAAARHVKLTSALAFDIGVYLVVVGLALMVFESFGDDPPPVDDDRRRVRAPVDGAGAHERADGGHRRRPVRDRHLLLLQRKLSRIIIGLGLLSHGANVLLVTSGRRGLPPIIGQGDPARLRRPAAPGPGAHGDRDQLRRTALLLALAYRSWLLTDDDEVADDIEDRPSPAAATPTSRSPTRRCSPTTPSRATTSRTGAADGPTDREAAA